MTTTGLIRGSMVLLAMMAVMASWGAEKAPFTLTISAQSPAPNVEKFEFGARKRYNFTIQNNTDRAVVIIGIQSRLSPNEEPITLFGEVYGSIEKCADQDAYRENPLAQMATIGNPFFAGLLLPNQFVTITAPYRVIDDRDNLAITYRSAAQPYDHTPASLAPLRVYIHASNDQKDQQYWSFVPFSEKQWLDNSAASVASIDSVRSVIISDGLKGDPLNTVVSVPFSFRDPQPGMTYLQARALAYRIIGNDFPADKIEIAYSQALGGFFIVEGDKRWVLSRPMQRERGDLFPEMPLTVLNDVDLNGSLKIRVGKKQEGIGPEQRLTGKLLWDTYPIYYGDGMYTNGEFITVSAAQLRAFLLRMREAGGILLERSYFIRSRYFEMQLLL